MNSSMKRRRARTRGAGIALMSLLLAILLTGCAGGNEGETTSTVTVGPSISGRVSDAVTGLGISSATVHLTPQAMTATTGGEGEFSFSVPAQGTGTITITAAGYLQEQFLNVAVGPGKTTFSGDLIPLAQLVLVVKGMAASVTAP